MKRILITTGNGMFGRALAWKLKDRDVNLRILVRDPAKFNLSHPRAEVVVADLDKPETLAPVMKDVDGIFLSTPMDPRLAQRETAVIRAAMDNGVSQIVKIAGSVRHEGDELSRVHGEVLEFLNKSGIPLTLISPNSLMETAMNGFAASVKYMHAIYGISGHGRIGFVALDDISEASATVLTSPGHEGMNYELTGPESIDLYTVAERFSEALDKHIVYVDLSEEKFARMMLKFDKTMSPDRLDIEVLCHLRAWKDGKADLVTHTFEKLTGKKPTSFSEFIIPQKDSLLKGMVPGFMAMVMRLSV